MVTVSIALVLPSGEREQCELRVVSESPIKVVLQTHNGPVEGIGADLFDAICTLRGHLEQSGGRLLCNAARTDAYPSRMSREMGSGRMVYILRTGMPASRADLVDMFEPADSMLVGSVDEQRKRYEEWVRSLR